MVAYVEHVASESSILRFEPLCVEIDVEARIVVSHVIPVQLPVEETTSAIEFIVHSTSRNPDFTRPARDISRSIMSSAPHRGQLCCRTTYSNTP